MDTQQTQHEYHFVSSCFLFIGSCAECPSDPEGLDEPEPPKSRRPLLRRLVRKQQKKQIEDVSHTACIE